MNVEISTTKYKILQSGSVIVPFGEDVEFNIEGLTFRFKFQNDVKEDGKLKDSSFNMSTDEGEKCLNINLVNMKNSFCATNTRIIDVATIKDEKLFLKFCITSINKQKEECDYLLNYTWYLQK